MGVRWDVEPGGAMIVLVVDGKAGAKTLPRLAKLFLDNVFLGLSCELLLF